MDSFDEIGQDAQREVCSWVNILVKQINQIWIASRKSTPINMGKDKGTNLIL